MILLPPSKPIQAPSATWPSGVKTQWSLRSRFDPWPPRERGRRTTYQFTTWYDLTRSRMSFHVKPEICCMSCFFPSTHVSILSTQKISIPAPDKPLWTLRSDSCWLGCWDPTPLPKPRGKRNDGKTWDKPWNSLKFIEDWWRVKWVKCQQSPDLFHSFHSPIFPSMWTLRWASPARASSSELAPAAKSPTWRSSESCAWKNFW